MEVIKSLIEQIEVSIKENTFSKVSLSKPWSKGSELNNVYARLVELKGEQIFSFTFSYKTNDQTKNFEIKSGLKELANLILKEFKNATLITSEMNYQLMANKKGKRTLLKTKSTIAKSVSNSHDRTKSKFVTGNELYLQLLGVSDKEGNIIPKMADKYKQINKYLEIVEDLLSSVTLSDAINVVDMGSGKGYLTFALYDYLKNKQGKKVEVVGVEMRKDLVKLCNEISQKCEFDGLSFSVNSIQNFKQEKIDILIALHACDTATDDALASGIAAKASLVISAPCCHKQIRKEVKGVEQKSPLLNYGIFKERQFEMVTDTIRALILERNQYQSKIFEFVSNEHTRKNVLLVGTKTSKSPDVASINDKINAIKSEFGIQKHYLEELV